MPATVRLQRFLARAGVASRRRAEDIIAAGRVAVNGVTVQEPGTRVDPETDVVAVDGEAVIPAPIRWLVFHKPAGLVCTRHDPQKRRTVYDVLPPDAESLFTVGRLDANTEGLLLLTNDGDAANRLLHPRYRLRRVYDVEVRGSVSAEALKRLERGVALEDGLARASDVRCRTVTGGRSRLRLSLREGRKREVRRMLEAVGYPVLRLRRIRFGPIALGGLARGASRELTESEARALEAATRIRRGTNQEREA